MGVFRSLYENPAPMLAVDAVLEKIKYPVFVQPKIDGVRLPRLFQTHCTGRSGKPFGNAFTNIRFGKREYFGLDGELVLGSPVEDGVCRATSSATSTHSGNPELAWYIFDNISDTERYSCRLYKAAERVKALGLPYIKIVPSSFAEHEEALLEQEKFFLDSGYEGVILRDPNGLYKHGRSTVREGGLLRIKRFVEKEGTVVHVYEAEANFNEAKKDIYGRTERSTHQENKEGKEMVGSLGVLDENEKLLTIGPGAMNHAERKRFWVHKELLIGRKIKFKYFPYGILDKPRFPTFVDFA